MHGRACPQDLLSSLHESRFTDRPPLALTMSALLEFVYSRRTAVSHAHTQLNKCGLHSSSRQTVPHLHATWQPRGESSNGQRVKQVDNTCCGFSTPTSDLNDAAAGATSSKSAAPAAFCGRCSSATWARGRRPLSPINNNVRMVAYSPQNRGCTRDSVTPLPTAETAARIIRCRCQTRRRASCPAARKASRARPDGGSRPRRGTGAPPQQRPRACRRGKSRRP